MSDLMTKGILRDGIDYDALLPVVKLYEGIDAVSYVTKLDKLDEQPVRGLRWRAWVFMIDTCGLWRVRRWYFRLYTLPKMRKAIVTGTGELVRK